MELSSYDLRLPVLLSRCRIHDRRFYLHVEPGICGLEAHLLRCCQLVSCRGVAGIESIVEPLLLWLCHPALVVDVAHVALVSSLAMPVKPVCADCHHCVAVAVDVVAAAAVEAVLA